MTKFAIRSLQVTLGAIALSVAGLAAAQTPAQEPAPAAATTAPAKHMHKKGHKHHHHHGKKHGQRDVSSGSSSAREAAAAREEERRGRLGGDHAQDQYQRNALARCDVFKTEPDKQACVGRMTQGQISGAVQDGGALREFTQQVPAR